MTTTPRGDPAGDRTATDREPAPDLRDTPAAAVAGKPTIVVHLSQRLDEALSAFRLSGTRHLVILDDRGRAAGVLTDRAVASLWARDPASFGSMHVADAYDGTEPSVPDDASLGQAARIMARDRCDAAVLVDARHRPVGVITTTDLIALLATPPRHRGEAAEPAGTHRQTTPGHHRGRNP